MGWGRLCAGVLGLGIVFGVVAEAPAAPIVNFSFDGVVNGVGPGPVPSWLSMLRNGDAFTFSFDLDVGATNDTLATPYGGNYPGAVTNVRWHAPSRGIDIQPGVAAAMVVSNSPSDRDELRFDINLADNVTLTFWLRDSTRTALPDSLGDDIPDTIDITQWGYLRAASFHMTTTPFSTIISGSLLVPEPTGAALAAAGLAGTLLRRRRR